MKKTLNYLFIMFSFLLVFFNTGQKIYVDAASQAPTSTPIGIYLSQPFVYQDGAHYSGMAIELWEATASSLSEQFEYREYPSFEALVSAVQSGEVRAAVTNLTITKDRASRVTFSQPWYDAGLRIMVTDVNKGGFLKIVGGLEAAGHLNALMWMAVFIVISTFIFAIIYRKFDKTFPRQWHIGLSESFYEVMSVATSGKVTRPNIFGWVGRISGGLWMVCGVAIIAYFTSSITSVMTMQSLNQHINSIADLPGKSIGVLKGSVAEIYSQKLLLNVTTFIDTENAVTALREGSIDAIIGDAPVLEHYSHTDAQSDLSVVGPIFHPDKYGFSFQYNDPIAHEITLRLLEYQESGKLNILRSKYFGNN